MILGLGLLLASCHSMKPIANRNLAYHYVQGFPLQVKHRVLEIGDDLSVFIQINFRKLSSIKDFRSIWDKYSIIYTISKDYESFNILVQDSLGPENRINPSVNPLVLFLKIPKAQKNRLLSLTIKEKQGTEVYTFDIPIREEEPGNMEAALFSKNGRHPVFDNYIQAKDTVVLRTFSFGNDEPELEFHPFNKSVALPPMAAIPTSGNDFEKSYAVKISPNQRMVFKEPGYYFLPSKNHQNQGFGFMVAEPYFPTPGLPLELIDPMIYISTREERKNLLEASNQKMALDQFWLKANSQKEVSRKLIKSYFENVEGANSFFSSHKAGWKTDQGMVYAIYGPPPAVFKNDNLEIWQYDKSVGMENSVFYFSRRNYIKDPNVWELKRFNEYDRVWYGVVELWRKGVINR